MMDKVRVFYRSMASLREDEIALLYSLTINPTDGRRSIFKWWLDHYLNSRWLHTAIVTKDNRIIGWSAANMGDGWNLGTIGVFIHPEFRAKGYARLAIDCLLPKLGEFYPKWPQYLAYEAGKERIFRPSIVRSIFKDRFLDHEEYELLRRKMCAG